MMLECMRLAVGLHFLLWYFPCWWKVLNAYYIDNLRTQYRSDVSVCTVFTWGRGVGFSVLLAVPKTQKESIIRKFIINKCRTIIVHCTPIIFICCYLALVSQQVNFSSSKRWMNILTSDAKKWFTASEASTYKQKQPHNSWQCLKRTC